MTQSSSVPPEVGSLVFTSDGDELGRVKEVSGECFNVDAPLAIDYWLSADTVESETNGTILLRISKEELNEERHKEPGHTGVHAHL